MVEPFGDDKDAGPAKRPAQTIEGTATEVSVEPSSGGSTQSTERAAGEEEPDIEEPKTEPGAKKVPPYMAAAELKSFLTHLAAGLLGGLIGVVALAIAWKLIPVRTTEPPDISALQTKLDKLEATDAKAIASLDERIKTVEARKVEAPPDLSGLNGRVARLEESLEALAETTQDGSVADAAALDAKIGDMERRLQAQIVSALEAEQGGVAGGIEALQEEVTTLKAKLGALAEAKLGAEGTDLTPALAAFDQRIAKLEAALPGLSTAIDQSAARAGSGLTELHQRLAKLEGALPNLSTAVDQSAARAGLTELHQRIAKLEAALPGLSTAIDQSAARAGSGLTELHQRIAKLEGALPGLSTAIDQSAARAGSGLTELNQRIAKLEGALPGLSTAIDQSAVRAGSGLSDLNQRVAKLEAALPELSTAIDQFAAKARSGAAAFAFGKLRDAVSSGRPYATELAAIRSLLPETPDLGPLPAHAKTGIPTIPELAAELQALAQASLAPPPASPDDSFLGSVIASAKSAIDIRRIDATATGSDASAVLARAEAHLKKGELAAAVKEVDALPEPSRKAFAGWLENAHARISADDTLSKLERAVLSSLGGAAGASGEAVRP